MSGINEIIYVCEYPECEYSNTKKYKFNKHVKRHTSEKKFICDVEGCLFRSKTSSDLKIHKNKHITERNFPCDINNCNLIFKSQKELNMHKKVHDKDNLTCICDYPDCNYKCRIPSVLIRHQRTHLNIKPYLCDYPNCNFKSTESYALTIHQRIHLNIKTYKCDYLNCDYKCITSDRLKQHQKIHFDIKPYLCDYPDCDYKCKSSSSLTKHKKIHGEKKIFCDFPGCNFKCHILQNLKIHKILHNLKEEDKKYVCNFDNCNAKFLRKANFLDHMNRHLNIRAYHCPYDDCNHRSNTDNDLKTHIENWHTKEGMNRKKRQEQRLRTILQKKYAIDEEIVLRYRNGCVYDPDKYYARIDFQIVGIINHCVIVECDEFAHKSYELSCELSRMDQIHESVIKGGETRQLIFIRYNPNGKFYHEDTEIKMTRTEREEKLIKLLASIASGEITYTEPLNIIYMFYDTNEDNYPKITEDPDYDNKIKGCIIIV
jgi:KRAB domain-containing zinc finger protein